jgi:NAD(P)-dependent dehydrogenase (short-subunit alcohol dehydrogenase family)
MDREDLSGKNYVVTGANSGIGFIAAQRFAELGANVALLCRSE